MELDDLLPIVEAAELLGFAHVQEGDLLLTPLGQTFADASILARKEIVAGRMLRLPTIRWIYETLQQDDDDRVDRDYFLEKLRSDFGDAARRSSTSPSTGLATRSSSRSTTTPTSSTWKRRADGFSPVPS